MRHGEDRRLWIVIGALGGLALGIALIPLRSVVSASNLAFVFIAFTIVVAELGGRGAALVTAVVSTLTLDFFLTEPYLSLQMQKTEDLVAFGALAVCGLIAAAFGRRRDRLSALAEEAQDELGVLSALVGQLRAGAPLDDVLEALRDGFGLRAIVLRDDERIVAAAARDRVPERPPDTELVPETLLPDHAARLASGPRGLRLPAGGARLPLRLCGRAAALDLWEGDRQGFGVNEVRALTIAASLLALELARRPAAPAAP